MAPGVGAVGFGISAVGGVHVVVHDHLVALPVAFAGGEYAGACILEHRDEERQDERLRENVLRGAIQPGALPLPRALAGVEVAPVAGPYREVAPLQSLRYLVGIGHRSNPRITLVLNVAPCAPAGHTVAPSQGDKFLDGCAVGQNLYAPRVVGRGHQPFRGKASIGEQADAVLFGIDLHVCQSDGVVAGVCRVGVVLEVVGKAGLDLCRGIRLGKQGLGK